MYSHEDTTTLGKQYIGAITLSVSLDYEHRGIGLFAIHQGHRLSMQLRQELASYHFHSLLMVFRLIMFHSQRAKAICTTSADCLTFRPPHNRLQKHTVLYGCRRRIRQDPVNASDHARR